MDGTYRCVCNTGYRLSADNRACIGQYLDWDLFGIVYIEIVVFARNDLAFLNFGFQNFIFGLVICCLNLKCYTKIRKIDFSMYSFSIYSTQDLWQRLYMTYMVIFTSE